MKRPRFPKSRRLQAITSKQTHGGWVIILIGLYLVYRFELTGCSTFPFVPCGTASFLVAIFVLTLGGLIVVGRALISKSD